jgi:rod shape-determining protein MreC
MKPMVLIPVAVFLVAVFGILAISPRTTQRIQSGALGLIAPFLGTGSTLQRRMTAFREGVKSLGSLEQENGTLRVENKELKAVNLMLRDLEQQNNKLRRALEYRERSVFKLIPARVVARDSSTWWNTVKINRGFAHGIEPDMSVLTEDGLVGKTTTVAKDMATVLLIADENCRVAVSVEGTREQGIVKGERASTGATPIIGLSFLSKNAGLQPGQKVFSSGVGGVFPSGVAIGSVKEFKVRALDGYASIIPAVDLATLEDVFVVAGKK